MTYDWIAERTDVDPGGCWLWTSTIAWNGYGAARNKEAAATGSRIAHRAVWITLVGPIPDGLDLDHLCRVRHCVNPDHLEPVTRSENLRRSPLVGQHFAEQTHCKNGHEYTPANIYARKDRPGRRQCRTCSVEATIRWRERTAA